MLVEVRRNETPIDTTIGEVIQNPRGSETTTLFRPSERRQEEYVENVTSNCAFIDGDPMISGHTYNSTKAIRLTRRMPINYTVKARRKVFDILESLKNNDCNKAMFIIYECFMDTRVEQDYHICDEILHSVMDLDFDIRINLSFLMASYSLKKHLSYRSMFYDMVCKKARMLNEYETLVDTLIGLR
jgi:hypothetical protein